MNTVYRINNRTKLKMKFSIGKKSKFSVLYTGGEMRKIYEEGV